MPVALNPRAARLALDGTRCDGHGICALRCPERIALDQWGYAVVADDPIVEPRTLARARRAAAACPAGALVLLAPASSAGR